MVSIDVMADRTFHPREVLSYRRKEGYLRWSSLRSLARPCSCFDLGSQFAQAAYGTAVVVRHRIRSLDRPVAAAVPLAGLLRSLAEAEGRSQYHRVSIYVELAQSSP